MVLIVKNFAILTSRQLNQIHSYKILVNPLFLRAKLCSFTFFVGGNIHRIVTQNIKSEICQIFKSSDRLLLGTVDWSINPVLCFCCRASGFNSWPRNIFWSWNLVENNYFWKSKTMCKKMSSFNASILMPVS